jgi:ABC-type thiamine transport system ATPase subunit
MMGGEKYRLHLRTCKLGKGTVWTTEYFSGGDTQQRAVARCLGRHQ